MTVNTLFRIAPQEAFALKGSSIGRMERFPFHPFANNGIEPSVPMAPILTTDRIESTLNIPSSSKQGFILSQVLLILLSFKLVTFGWLEGGKCIIK